jgi:hypothetical protein
MKRQCRECKTVTLEPGPWCDACGCRLPQPERGLSKWQIAFWLFAVATAPFLFEHFVLGWF